MWLPLYILVLYLIVSRLAKGGSLKLVAAAILGPLGVFGVAAAVLLPTHRLINDVAFANIVLRHLRYPKGCLEKLYLNCRYGCEQWRAVYHDLDQNSRQIRLVVILPGATLDRIYCRLYYIQLADTAYEALSYTWGSNSSFRSITVNGFPFHVTKNLEVALKWLRYPDKERFVWIDAISINQNNIREREQQVSLMRTIYTSATAVVVWLGDRSSSNDCGMDFLAQADTEEDKEGWFLRILTSNQDIYVDQWKAVLHLFQREYWRRIWVVQEIACATKLTILCGSRAVPWEIIVATQSAWIQVKGAIQSPLLEEENVFRYFLTRDLTYQDCGPLPLEANRKTHMENEILVSLVNLLHTNWTAFATDPRDKIYALVGLAADCQDPAISIDYSLSL